jgi:hypothetical protein
LRGSGSGSSSSSFRNRLGCTASSSSEDIIEERNALYLDFSGFGPCDMFGVPGETDESDPFIFADNDRRDLDISLNIESWLADQVTLTNVRQFEATKLDIQRCLTNLTDEFEDLRWALERFMKGSLATAQIG